MKLLIPLLALAALPASLLSSDGVDVRVTVTNIPGVKGNMLVGIFDSSGSFTRKALKNSQVKRVSSTSPMTVTIPNVPPGTYAISVVQDLNGNGKLDKKITGMPEEPLGFSRIKSIPRGRPSFSACSFTVGSSDVSMTIRLVTK